MLTLLVAVTLSGAQPCSEPAAVHLREAAARVQAFDLAGAVARLRDPGASGCEDLDLATLYLGGLSAALEAYKQGGSEESLVPVREAIGELEKMSGQRPGPAEVARCIDDAGFIRITPATNEVCTSSGRSAATWTAGAPLAVTTVRQTPSPGSGAPCASGASGEPVKAGDITVGATTPPGVGMPPGGVPPTAGGSLSYCSRSSQVICGPRP